MNSAREHLLRIYQQALAAVQGDVCTRTALSASGLKGPLAVIAIGKAAQSMMQGALETYGEQLVSGLIISKTGHLSRKNQDSDFPTNYVATLDDSRLSSMEAGHPIPDERSLQAGLALLSFMEKQSAQTGFVFLISGGASALVEVLPQNMTLAQLQRLNQWLLSSGLDIHDMNRVRRAFSCIKGGRLAAYLQGRRALCLMISDVPGDLPHIIGSGLLFSPETDSRQVALGEGVYQDGVASTSTFPGIDVPPWVNQLPLACPVPLRDACCFKGVKAIIVATLEEAKQAAIDEAISLGYAVIRHDDMVTGDAQTVGQQLAQELLAGPPGVHVWGGETTVSLPDVPGQGGRNQHLALAAAKVIAGHAGHFFMSVGTDGTDGPTMDAGALVDAETIERAKNHHFDALVTLKNADSGRFLRASGDVIRTGPTGTNVMDLMLGLKL